MKRMILCCCLAALFASCEELLNSEPVTGDPIYSAGILYGTAIESADDLKKIGVDPDWPLDGDYYLAADIDLAAVPESEDPDEGELEEAAETAWTPIGPAADNAFTGTFNGNGKTISGLKLSAGEDGTNIYTGLFGYLNMAQIWDLTVELANPLDEPVALSANVAQYIGVLAGYAKAATISGITVKAAENCGLYSKKTNSNPGTTGGIAGKLDTGMINDSTVSLDLKSDIETAGAQYSGLITGDNNSMIITGCITRGSVSIKKTGNIAGNIAAGGISGYATSGRLIERCVSYVTTIAAESGGTGKVYAGGIAGYAFGTAFLTSCSLETSDAVSITAKSTNSGSGTDVYAGGIMGSGSEIYKCFVNAPVQISAETAGNAEIAAGGIAGTGTKITASYVYHSSGVTVLAKASNTGTSSYKLVAAGGIAGRGATIKNCFSVADVSLDSALKTGNSGNYRTGAGGLAGLLVMNSGEMENSYVAGSVTVVSANTAEPVYAGGLVGFVSNNNSGITVKSSVALNNYIGVQSGTQTVYANRVIGKADSEDTVAKLFLSNLYASSGMTIQKKINGGEWETIDQSTNNAGDFTGSANFDRDQNFFQSLPDWDFTGPGGARPPVWDWDDTLNLPVLHGN